MENSSNQPQDHYFLPGWSEVAVAIFGFDWTATSLGDLRNWPVVLKQSLSMALNSPVPMLIFWGAEFIVLYNDAFEPYATKSGFALGQPAAQAGQPAWTELAAAFQPVYSCRPAILRGVCFGEGSGERFDVYCSAIQDESADIQGIGAMLVAASAFADTQSVNEELAASNEELQAINEELLAVQQAQEESMAVISLRERQMAALVESAPFPIAVYTGPEMRIVQANRSLIELWGKGNDIIGKTYFEVLPELSDQHIYERLTQVYETGVAYHVRNQPVNLMVNGRMQEFFFNYSFTPLFDGQNRIYGILNTAADVTDLNQAKKQLEHSQENFRNMILQAPVAMCRLMGPDFVVEVVNSAMLEIWGKPLDEVMNRPVFDALPDARSQGLEEAMAGVYRSGVSFSAKEQPVELTRHGKQETVYQNFVYQAYRDSDGCIQGILAISVNVTEQVLARLELHKAYEQIRLSKQAAQLGTFDMDLIEGTMDWDERCRKLFGIDHAGPVTYESDFLAGLHPDDRERIESQISRLFDPVNSGGDYDVEYRTVGASDGRVRWVQAKGKVYFSGGLATRFIGSVMDITAQKLSQLRLAELAEKQARLAAVVASSDDVIISKTLEGIITSWNFSAQRVFGYSEQEAIGKHISIIIPEERLQEEDFIISKICAGEKVDHFETVRKTRDGRLVQLSLTVSPIIDEQGKIIGASKIARDNSQELAARQNARKYTERLEIMNMVMTTISEELELNKILQKVTDATTELTGAKFGAFFYNKTDERGGSYMLYTLSGAPREAFEKFGMPRNTAIFERTFSGSGIMRVDDITSDPRYGHNAPHYGMPKGHLPVVSYLAVPVISRSGNVIGGLFFGHPEPARFTAEHETLVSSIAAQSAISIDNAKLFEEVKGLNDKKDEFIALASHELKTPLASIHGYLQILNRLPADEQQKKFMSKAGQQVLKLTSLVNDLLDVSKIEAGKMIFSYGEFDLQQVVTEAIELIQHSSGAHRIIFDRTADGCMVYGDSARIEQVMINLLSNAVKYSPNADTVEVKVTKQEDTVVIAVRDFGPGVPEDKLKHIFNRFYRIDELTPNISGLGIGLYLSREIIGRHQGDIWAERAQGNGTVFFVSLPAFNKASAPIALTSTN
ncbi:PAS domain S-box protein [Pedobacter deserti]|uniref:PAS domain S-box protein n=1 Tax=Pedobacter deserti TaxID=2817382 RepID=UPI002108DC62|nr:PAS domain S-box protein [Pedobacter sp. SYSU D00382]